MKKLLLTLICFLSFGIFAQTWSDDVAAIVYEKCSKCHNPNGVGPFPLTSYAETSAMALAMYDAINLENMPPWPPNNDYQQYVHDRSLTPTEKTTMLDWLTNGTPQGNISNAPPPPVFPSGSLLGNGDLEIQIPTYMSKALSGSDDYVCFAMPSNLPQDRIIKSMEIIPGNREIVHHALIYIDPTGTSVTDTVGGDCGGPSSNSASLIMGYTPGSSPLTLPSSSPLKLGIPLPANSQVYFAMHYPEGSYGEYDSTKVIFHFYPPGETGIREVFASPVIQKWNMVIPPDQFTSVSAQYPNSGGITTDISVLSVFPHMHLLGEEMTVYGLNSAAPNDTMKMIDIPHWDFHWQDFYFFKNMIKAPIGTTFYADGVYNNTSGNIHNPNSPPITVYAGLNTSDEMFLVYAHYMLYQAGDENYNMDSLMNLASLPEIGDESSLFSIFPNPFHEGVTISTTALTPGDRVSMHVYDQKGQLISKLMDNQTATSGKVSVEWNGTNQVGEVVSDGLYFISVNINGNFSHHKLVKR